MFNILDFTKVKYKIYAALVMFLGFILLSVFGSSLEWFQTAAALSLLYISIFMLIFKLVDPFNWKNIALPVLFIFGLMAGIQYLGWWFVLLVALGIPFWRLWKYRFALLYAMWLFINDKNYRSSKSVTLLALNVFLRTEDMSKSWKKRS